MKKRPRICGVYKITNILNGDCYIGSSFDCIKRLNNHKSYLKCNTHRNAHLQRAYNKYCLENFTFEIIEECEKSEDIITKLENSYITKYAQYDKPYPAYNNRSDARVQLGYRASEETKKKLSSSRIGKKHSPKTLAKLTSFLKGDGARQKYKSVERINPITGEIKEYESIKAAAQEGFHAGHISGVLRGVADKHGGYYWQFINPTDRKNDAKPVIRKKRTYKTKAVEAINILTGEVTEYLGLRKAGSAGFNRKIIKACCDGKRKDYNGYFWQYIEK